MLHSFYTEIEKIFTLIAREIDQSLPNTPNWHRELLVQMAAPTSRRAAVISDGLRPALGDYLAFRHLFRGASIALMRWEKLIPLLNSVDQTHRQFSAEVSQFLERLRPKE